MLKNYFRIAVRNLIKNKVFSFINIFGLAIGLACFMLITSFLVDELGYDRYSAQVTRLYRVGIRLDQNGGMADYPDVDVAVGAGMKRSFPEIIASTRIYPIGETFVKFGDRQFKERHIAMCDSNFLQLFSIPLLEGDAQTALVYPGTIVITKDLAKKYFGAGPAIGNLLMVMGGLKVTGVIDKVPDNSHFHFDAFVSMATNKGAMTGTTWSNIGFYTYLQLDEKADPKKLEAAFSPLTEKYIVPETQHDMGVSMAEARRSINNWHFYLMPVTAIHLYSNTKYEMDTNGDIQYIYIFGSLAAFILLLACVNFTNLSTASSAKRSKEVGIRKVLGSLKKQLVGQFLTESLLLTFCAMLIALLLVYLLLPSFNRLSGKQISLSLFLEPRAILAALGLTLFVAFLAGIYPAFFLSSFQPITTLKGGPIASPAGRRGLRSSLVVFQFMISTSLIVTTIVTYRQLHFMQNKKLGYDKDQVLVIQDTYTLRQDQYAFKEQLLKDARVLNATISRDAPVDRAVAGFDGSEVYAKENKENENASEIHSFYFHVDYDYIATLGMQMATGRFFSKDFPGDSSGNTVINETAVHDLGWKNNSDAIGKIVISSGRHEFRVVGVVRDFNYTSVKQKIAPLMMMLGGNSGSIMVKIKTADVSGFLADTKKQWAAFNTGTPFSYYFLDDRFASMYSAEQKTGQIFTMFAILAIVIASLGLFGLVAFTTEQRTKEIGIRKVLGASVSQVLILLTKKFLWLVCMAFVISVPITWWAMHNWLNKFAYRINLNGWVFLLGGATALAIALITICFEAIKAAFANPVKSLRKE